MLLAAHHGAINMHGAKPASGEQGIARSFRASEIKRFQPSRRRDKNPNAGTMRRRGAGSFTTAATADAASPPMPTGRAVVAGGGPGGALAALVLAQNGYRVDVFEARSEPDPAAQEPARSYALVRCAFRLV